mgnify:CR=1 FL=1
MLTSTIQIRFIRINEVFYLATDLTIDSRIDLTIASTIALIIRCVFCEGGEYTHYKVSISCNRIKTRTIGGK